MKKTSELGIKGTVVRVVKINGEDFVCLTDMAKLRSEDPSFTINHWMRSRMTIEYLGLWETLYNPNFKPTEFGRFREECGLNTFVLSPTKWITATDAIGMVALFGQTHQQWQLAHPDLKGNQRDYATVNQLICISNMENINAVMINGGIPQPQRLKKLNEVAIQQMRILSEIEGRTYLK